MRYEVSFSGTAYVEADSADEAGEKFAGDDFTDMYTEIDSVREDNRGHM